MQNTRRGVEVSFDDELLTVSEVSVLLRLRESTVRSWLFHRRLTYTKIGRKVFVKRAHALAVIEAGVVPAREER